MLVWNKAPLMFGNALVPVDRFAAERQAQAGEVKRLGDKPIVIELVSDGAKIEVAARSEDRTLARAP